MFFPFLSTTDTVWNHLNINQYYLKYLHMTRKNGDNKKKPDHPFLLHRRASPVSIPYTVPRIIARIGCGARLVDLGAETSKIGLI